VLSLWTGKMFIIVYASKTAILVFQLEWDPS